jgi:uncharacterized iron-regulated membrane protein
MAQARDIHRDKTMIALLSVLAAVGLAGMQLMVGLLTGSLGIWPKPLTRAWTWLRPS